MSRSNLCIDGGGGTSVSFGSENQIPITNSSGNDFDYSSGLVSDGTGYYFYTENATTQNNGAATNVSYINATSGVLQAGTWSIDFSAIGGNTNANKSTYVSFWVDGVQRGTEFNYKTNDSGNRVSFALSEDQTLTAGTHTFEIRFRAGGGTSVLDFGTIRARLVN